jgi:hypothetical protein
MPSLNYNLQLHLDINLNRTTCGIQLESTIEPEQLNLTSGLAALLTENSYYFKPEKLSKVLKITKDAMLAKKSA